MSKHGPGSITHQDQDQDNDSQKCANLGDCALELDLISCLSGRIVQESIEPGVKVS